MIRTLKDILKRYWPALPLRSILFLTLLFVAALPGVGAVSLRVYENTLVQQTEAELIAQAAALSGAYRAAWREGEDQRELRSLEPQRPTIDLNAMPILPEQPRPVPARVPPEPRAQRVATSLAPVVADTRQTTLASIRMLDARGTVLLGPAYPPLSFGQVPEVRSGMAGRTTTVLRRRADYAAYSWLEFLSRASGINVHYVRPVMLRGQVIGILMLSRSPRGLFLGMYQDRGKIAIGVGTIFATLLVLAGLLSRGIARPIETLREATQNVARGSVAIPDPPVTAAVEIRALYEAFGTMAERIERRSRYLRDFAAAVSHEFKTPIAGMRGALELLEEHGATMSEEERQRFLANAMGDADRLSHLLQRLLHLARADMTVSPEDSASDIAEPLRRVADAHQGIAVVSDIPPDLALVAAPAELVESVLETLVENSQQAGASTVRIGARGEGGSVLLTVSDDGPGISGADHERVFEPFHTSRRAEGGSGLGLSIARSLLASCSGTIVSKASDGGACFEISLPAASR
ncbi:MAG TPA: HAMP domain-containing sensor histidine kinase [Allosphingosinicella sp.]